MIKRLAKYILRDELKETKTRIDDLELRLELRSSLYDHVNFSLIEYQKIRSLLAQDVFKSLCRLLAKEYEEVEQGIGSPEDMHRFWHCQGAKSVLHTILTLDATIKQTMIKMQSKKPAEEESPASVADYS